MASSWTLWKTKRKSILNQQHAMSVTCRHNYWATFGLFSAFTFFKLTISQGPGNTAWGEDKSLMLYLRDENSGRWKWGQRKMKQGKMEEMQGDLLPWSPPLHKMWTNTADGSFCLKWCLQTSSTCILHLRRSTGRRKEMGLSAQLPIIFHFSLVEDHCMEG